MSKKKAFSGSTMTLKDFHGGSIPSELHLPSAPGLSTRQPDRIGPDRSVPPAWGRPEPHRPSRPGSAGGPRTFDEASPFLPATARIGRHFDEDERKPFDASSAPRRLPAPDPDPARLSHAPQALTRPTSSPGSTGLPAAPNAWGMVQREAVAEPVGVVPASKFMQASAMDQIASGRWQLKSSAGVGGAAAVVEVVTFPETDRRTAGGVNYEARSSGRIEVEGRYNGVVNGHGLYGVPAGVEAKGRSGFGSPPDSGEGRYSGMRSRQHDEGRFGGQQVQHLEGRLGELHLGQRGHSEVLKFPLAEESRAPQQVEKYGMVQMHNETPDSTERPKLRLLPRSKPLESLDHASDSKQVMQGAQTKSSEVVAPYGVKDIYISPGPVKSGATSAEGINEAVERPRLNLKPRSQPIGLTDGSIDRGRQSVFGGARPRELVLKERGVETDPNNSPPTLPESRTKRELAKALNGKQESATSRAYSDKPEFHSAEHHVDRDHERKDSKADPVKLDSQRVTRGSDNWRNTREHEKLPERRPEPENWRKPTEDPKPPEIPSPRVGKVSSALELAQAFSRSASAPMVVRLDTRLASTQKAVSNHTQLVPFSRLTDNREIRQGPASSRKINGY